MNWKSFNISTLLGDIIVPLGDELGMDVTTLPLGDIEADDSARLLGVSGERLGILLGVDAVDDAAVYIVLSIL